MKLKNILETALCLSLAFPPNVVWVLPVLTIWKCIENKYEKKSAVEVKG